MIANPAMSVGGGVAMPTRPRPCMHRLLIGPPGDGRVKRYRSVDRADRVDEGRDGDRPSPPPSLWDRDLWEEDLFAHAEPESTAHASNLSSRR